MKEEKSAPRKRNGLWDNSELKRGVKFVCGNLCVRGK